MVPMGIVLFCLAEDGRSGSRRASPVIWVRRSRGV